MSYPFNRAFYRIQYPIAAAPRFVAAGVAHRVVDCSETGFRYAPDDGRFPAVGSTVEGTLDFRGTEELDVRGTVVRIQAGEIAVHCGDTPIPLAVILREQRYLRVHYPFRAEGEGSSGSPAA
jgi:hypothetical protein